MTKSDSLDKMKIYYLGEIMNFIKKMKKREFIEMSLKALASILIGFIAIILMEGMIYSILLNGACKNEGGTILTPTGENVVYTQTLYAIEEGDKYKVLIHNIADDSWAGYGDLMTEEEISNYKNMVKRAPTAFELSIEPWHYAIMAVVILGIGGLFTYKFIRLAKSYKDIEKEFKETGTIELPNL